MIGSAPDYVVYRLVEGRAKILHRATQMQCIDWMRDNPQAGPGSTHLKYLPRK